MIKLSKIIVLCKSFVTLRIFLISGFFTQFSYKLLVFLNNVENIFLSIDKDNTTTDIYTKTKQAQELYDKLVNIKSSLEQIKTEIETNKNYITQYNSNNLGVSISKQIDFINNIACFFASSLKLKILIIFSQS